MNSDIANAPLEYNSNMLELQKTWNRNQMGKRKSSVERLLEITSNNLKINIVKRLSF